MAFHGTFLIDASCRINQLWRSSQDSQKTITTFCYDLLAFERVYKPNEIICAFDAPGRTFRDDLFVDYKKNHTSKRTDLIDALHGARNRLSQIGRPWYEARGFEADDVLATMAATLLAKSVKVVIASTDKDMRQLLRPDELTILRSWRREAGKVTPEWYTAGSLLDQHKIGPDKWVDFQCLVGDTSDNIPGARGVGKLTAAEWLSRCTLDEILADPVKVGATARQCESLAAFAPNVPLLRQLYTLRRDVPLR